MAAFELHCRAVGVLPAPWLEWVRARLGDDDALTHGEAFAEARVYAEWQAHEEARG